MSGDGSGDGTTEPGVRAELAESVSVNQNDVREEPRDQYNQCAGANPCCDRCSGPINELPRENCTECQPEDDPSQRRLRPCAKQNAERTEREPYDPNRDSKSASKIMEDGANAETRDRWHHYERPEQS